MISTNALGGGGSASGVLKAWAVIKVTYPIGSECTCSKGTKVYRAKDTSGEVIFGVPESGDWIVSCTNGTETLTKTVSIIMEYQVENVRFTYSLEIFRSGSGCCMNMYQGKYTTKQTDPQNLRELGYSAAFDVTDERFVSYGVESGICFFTEKFDATDLDTFYVDMELNGYHSALSILVMSGTDWLTTPMTNGSALGLIYYNYNTDGVGVRLTKSLDISSITGDVYLSAYDAANNGYKRYTVYNLWCE